MSLLPRGVQIQGNNYGILVTKAAQALPQNTTATLYTVAGGAVLIHGLYGRVATALGGTATTLALGTTAANNSIATAVAVTSAAAQSWVSPQASSGAAGALIVANVIYPPSAPFLTATTNITWTTNANDTGTMAWYLWYVPLDAGATVS